MMWRHDAHSVSTISATFELSGVPRTHRLFEGEGWLNPPRREDKIRVAAGEPWSALGSSRRGPARGATSIEELETALVPSPGPG